MHLNIFMGKKYKKQETVDTIERFSGTEGQSGEITPVKHDSAADLVKDSSLGVPEEVELKCTVVKEGDLIGVKTQITGGELTQVYLHNLMVGLCGIYRAVEAKVGVDPEHFKALFDSILATVDLAMEEQVDES